MEAVWDNVVIEETVKEGAVAKKESLQCFFEKQA